MNLLIRLRMMVLPLLIGSLGFSFQSLAEKTQMRALNVEDFTQIIRVIIDYPSLQKYLHAELPGRSPLKVLKQESFPEKLPLSKFDVPIDYLKREEIRKGDEAYLDFKNIDLKNDKAVVEFKYPVEGIVGEVELSKQHGAWAIEKFKIVER